LELRCHNFYGDGIDAWPGDEDQGQMSAWFVMAALGLFQIDGGCSVNPVYEICSPIFNKVEINLKNLYGRGDKFIIKAENVSKKNIYIQKATLNGRALNSCEFKAHELLNHSSRKIMKAADIIAYEHHERWDGSGYPQGLRGEDINILGRIVAIADVFDTMCHDRVYKKASTLEEAAEYIIQNSAKDFDPRLVAIFQEHLDEFLAIV